MAVATQPQAEKQAPKYHLRSNKTAMLVIHGIGEQNPYETLDSFARGVYSYLSKTRGLNARLCPVETAFKEWTQVAMRIEIFAPGAAPPACPVKDQVMSPPRPLPDARVDIFEYYWAPETEDKLSSLETLNWVLRTDLTPLRYFANNLQEMMGVWNLRFRPALWRSFRLYCREILRVTGFYVPLAIGLIWLIQWMAQPHEFGRALGHLIAALKANLGWQRTVVLAFYLLAGLMGWFALQSRTERLRSPGKPIQTRAEQLWFWSALISAALLLAAGFILAMYFNVDPGRIILRVLWLNATPLAAAGIAAFLCYALTAYVADVAVYVTADAKSKNYAARTAILKGSTQALVQLLTDQKYDRVILAGHSLGSVIAYDTINELLSQVNATPGPAADQPVPLLSAPELKKLKGLVTFGSPLDKIYYFFREHVKRDQAIRAQILSMLHSFRKLPSGRDYSPYDFNYSHRQLDDLIWLNAWAHMDPVSAKLKFYALCEQDQRCFPYRVPVLAHLSYWGDPNFYSFIGDRLL